ncbi:MAG: phosphopantothenoylcysteine decarboxylase [Phycisphaerales bacterium]|nr:phosphopantothenoylcysteine decarboxylase [Phycisphaerales bacterium]
MVISSEATRRLLITAGPTHEPIDAVRFLGNRSSGRLGCALSDYAQDHGWKVTLLLGPHTIRPMNPEIEVIGFQSTADLGDLLQTHFPQSDTLIMAAAVADYRPIASEIDLTGKRRREGKNLTIELESTQDLLAQCSAMARSNQFLVGFALEPKDRLMESALSKLERKNIDLIVANTLETMDSGSIEATLLGNDARGVSIPRSTQVNMTKADFAQWLIDQVTPLAILRMDASSESSTND